MANKRYDEFVAGSDTGDKILLTADPGTGELGKIDLTNLFSLNSVRLQEDIAPEAAAANDLVIGSGNLQPLTGNTQINAITTTGWQAGSIITLEFVGTPLVKNNTAGGAGTAPILLAGRIDFQAATGDILSLVYDGFNWYEINRALASGAGIVTADNGLTKNTATNVQLGGTLIQATTITGADQNFVITNTRSGYTYAIEVLAPGVNNKAGLHVTGSDYAIYAEGSSRGVYGSGNAYGVIGVSANGNALQGFTTDGISVLAQAQSTLGSDVQTIINIVRDHVAAASNGVGGSIDFKFTNTGGSNNLANQLISKWTDVTLATRTSQFIITGVNNAVTDNLIEMGNRVTLTESSATTFVSTTIPSSGIGGGEITVTVTADDATDFQARTLRFIWAAVNKAGTLTITISTPEEVVAVSAGTLTVTITAVDAGSGVLDFKANAVSSLTQTTLRCSYQMSKNF